MLEHIQVEFYLHGGNIAVQGTIAVDLCTNFNPPDPHYLRAEQREVYSFPHISRDQKCTTLDPQFLFIAISIEYCIDPGT